MRAIGVPSIDYGGASIFTSRFGEGMEAEATNQGYNNVVCRGQ